MRVLFALLATLALGSLGCGHARTTRPTMTARQQATQQPSAVQGETEPREAPLNQAHQPTPPVRR